MNIEEFIKQRCEIDKITEEEFKKKYRVVKCYCGQPYCKGYRCLDLDDLLRENQELKEKLYKYENPEDMTLLAMWCTEKVKEENQKLQTIANNCKQLKDNWNELKKYLHNVDVVVDYSENYDGHFINYDDLLDKMQELEQGSDSNE